jgi:hypothetical protein
MRSPVDREGHVAEIRNTEIKRYFRRDSREDNAQYVRKGKEKGFNMLWTEDLKRGCNR